ncbi:ATPase [Moraxella osloensis]|uniref:ATPase n=1 Tax=Faucicola osloensis TaxID=34062 RepID=A0AA91J8E3_FAUOS|nr:AAA family ATPase [Moraxella osloensis]OBX60559.1 ATPase [Moraxella osloensis]
MKILQSPYYQPRKLLSASSEPPYTVQLIEDNLQYASKYNPFESLLDDIFPGVHVGNHDMVIRKEQLKDFERCTDFTTVAYSHKNNTLYEREACYFHPKYEVFMLTNEDLSNDYDEYIFESGLLKVVSIYYISTNPHSAASVKNVFDEYLQKYVSQEAKVSILLKEAHGFVFKTHRIKPFPINLDTMYHEDFLPVHQHIKESLNHDGKGVVLLHGVAGSGKTNYIKWLTSQVPNKKFIFVPTTMIGYLTNPEFMSLLVDNKNSVLVLEDCENYIAERSIDNANTDVVSAILNIADGMLSDVLECQFICTFNSDISKIDPALLRKGRLIAEYKFKELSVEKSNAFLASIDKAITVNKPHSLAELTNMDDLSYREKQAEKPKFGFV